MTKIERWYDERQKKAVEVAVENEQKKSRNEKEEIVIRMLKTGDSVQKVVECTGFTVQEVQTLATRT